MDWIKLPPAPIGTTVYDTVLTFTNSATKVVHFVASNVHETAVHTAQLFVKHVVTYHGLPRPLQSDRDPSTMSEF